MKSIFGITIVLLFGAFCLLQSGTKVGDLITNTEAKNVWAGTCYNTGSRLKSVCASNCSSAGGCSCTETNNYAVASGGNKLSNVSCGTGTNCKYSNVSQTEGCGN